MDELYLDNSYLLAEYQLFLIGRSYIQSFYHETNGKKPLTGYTRSTVEMIEFESVGCSSYFESEMVDFEQIPSHSTPTLIAKTQWEKSIEKVDAFVHDAVFSGDAIAQLNTRIVQVIDMGNFALKFGEYYVGWTWEGKPNYIR